MSSTVSPRTWPLVLIAAIELGTWSVMPWLFPYFVANGIGLGELSIVLIATVAVRIAATVTYGGVLGLRHARFIMPLGALVATGVALTLARSTSPALMIAALLTAFAMFGCIIPSLYAQIVPESNAYPDSIDTLFARVSAYGAIAGSILGAAAIKLGGVHLALLLAATSYGIVAVIGAFYFRHFANKQQSLFQAVEIAPGTAQHTKRPALAAIVAFTVLVLIFASLRDSLFYYIPFVVADGSAHGYALITLLTGIYHVSVLVAQIPITQMARRKNMSFAVCLIFYLLFALIAVASLLFTGLRPNLLAVIGFCLFISVADAYLFAASELFSRQVSTFRNPHFDGSSLFMGAKIGGLTLAAWYWVRVPNGATWAHDAIIGLLLLAIFAVPFFYRIKVLRND